MSPESPLSWIAAAAACWRCLGMGCCRLAPCLDVRSARGPGYCLGLHAALERCCVLGRWDAVSYPKKRERPFAAFSFVFGTLTCLCHSIHVPVATDHGRVWGGLEDAGSEKADDTLAPHVAIPQESLPLPHGAPGSVLTPRARRAPPPRPPSATNDKVGTRATPSRIDCRTRATRAAHDDYLLVLSSSCVSRARGTAGPRSVRVPPYGKPTCVLVCHANHVRILGRRGSAPWGLSCLSPARRPR
eukprot:6396639-Prymnesium_polylepis.1